jgi:3-hydroxymyristoyl/3-hydroxydecanoyl-(acyl carrier protein) dehydratases
MTDKLNKEQIKELLPHREPMLLIDELINIQKLKSATAVVNVKKNSFLCTRSFSG